MRDLNFRLQFTVSCRLFLIFFGIDKFPSSWYTNQRKHMLTISMQAPFGFAVYVRDMLYICEPARPHCA